MLMLVAIFASSFVVALSGAMMPGTLFTVTVSESTRRGIVAGPLLILGHGLLELLLVAALLLGLAPFFTHRGFFLAASLVGGGVLLWMAVGMFRALPALKMDWDARSARQGNLVLTGMLMSIVNPYWIIWWATIGIGLLLQAKAAGPLGLASFFTGHISGDLAWYSLISVAVGKGRALFTDRVYRGVMGVCAAALVAFGGLFLFRAVAMMI